MSDLLLGRTSVVISFSCQSLGRRPLPLRPWDGELGILVIGLSVKNDVICGEWSEGDKNRGGIILLYYSYNGK